MSAFTPPASPAFAFPAPATSAATTATSAFSASAAPSSGPSPATTGAAASPSPSPAPAKTPAATYILFALVTIGAGLGGLTQTALNTMAADVLADLGTEIGWGQWITTAYIFSMGVAVPLASYLTKRFSVRSLLVGAFLLYLAGSLCDFAAQSFPMLLVGRVLEAVATGVLMPLLQTIAMTRFPENRHGTAMGVAGIALGFAPNVGPVIGGAIMGAAGWRFLFLVLVASSAALLALTILFVKERDVENASARLETISLLLAALGFGGLLAGFTDAANYELAHPLVWAPLVVGAVCLALFLRRQCKVPNPLVNLGIFASGKYRACFAAQCFLYGCFLGMTLIVPLFVIEGGGHSAFDAGLVLLPGAFAALVFEPLAGMASDRLGPRRVAIFGGAFLTAGAAGMAFLPMSTPLWVAAVFQTLRCVGLTTLIPTTTAWGLSDLRKRGITTDGSSFMIRSRQIVAAMATAIMVFLITAFATPQTPELGYHLALGFSGLLGACTLLTVVAFVRPREGRRAEGA